MTSIERARIVDWCIKDFERVSGISIPDKKKTQLGEAYPKNILKSYITCAIDQAVAEATTCKVCGKKDSVCGEGHRVQVDSLIRQVVRLEDQLADAVKALEEAKPRLEYLEGGGYGTDKAAEIVRATLKRLGGEA